MGTKTERLNLRLTQVQDMTLRRAAAAQGLPVSDYVLRHAVEAAESDLADRRVFVLGDKAWEALQEALSRPVRRAEELRRLIARPSEIDR